MTRNAGSFRLRRGFLKRPGTVRVVIGPPIDPRARKGRGDHQAVEEWIENEMVELERA